MKLLKLNSRGFSHDIGLVAFVVIFAIAGVAYLVASHADTCEPVSGAVSSAASAPVSGDCEPVSGPALAGTCEIGNVAANPRYGQTIAPSILVRNTGAAIFVPKVTFKVESLNNASARPISASQLKPGEQRVYSTGVTYPVGYSSGGNTQVVFRATSDTDPAFECKTVATLPTAPQPTAFELLLEAENMIASNKALIHKDSQASGKAFKALYRAGTISNSFTTAGVTNRIYITVKASQCEGAPKMDVLVDGKPVFTHYVGRTSWHTYNTPLNIPAGSHTAAVTFSHDRYLGKGCDRNLYVDQIKIAGVK